MNKKRGFRNKVRISTKLHNTQYRILLLLGFDIKGEILYQKNITKFLNLKLSSLNYHILQLRKKDLIIKENRLTDKGILLFQEIKGCLESK